MTTNLKMVNDESFAREVLEADVPVLVDFMGTWCGPCKTMVPVLQRVAAETEGRTKVVTVDADASPQTAAKYGIRGVPTFLVFRNGERAAQHVGTATRERILALLDP